MSGRLALTLPYPPSVNRLWRRRRDGGMYKIKAAKDYAANVALRVRMTAGWQALRPPYRVRVLLWPPDARRRDVDNIGKCLLDSIWAGLGQDDVTIAELIVTRAPAPDRINPRAEVVIEQIS